ncbi:translation initiation factor IF-2-like isoform X1 [Canis lupus familiaris]|uniref:translation initiation factor IF-2-like isoform X1 n=1 Tax=Canis lupus familiaris TaxID=9615 RepID=UPI0018F7DCFF|nr:translation initiation factor IF-2-like isoform X1 [Canis lupus familiaris]
MAASPCGGRLHRAASLLRGPPSFLSPAPKLLPRDKQTRRQGRPPPLLPPPRSAPPPPPPGPGPVRAPASELRLQPQPQRARARARGGGGGGGGGVGSPGSCSLPPAPGTSGRRDPPPGFGSRRAAVGRTGRSPSPGSAPAPGGELRLKSPPGMPQSVDEGREGRQPVLGDSRGRAGSVASSHLREAARGSGGRCPAGAEATRDGPGWRTRASGPGAGAAEAQLRRRPGTPGRLLALPLRRRPHRGDRLPECRESLATPWELNICSSVLAFIYLTAFQCSSLAALEYKLQAILFTDKDNLWHIVYAEKYYISSLAFGRVIESSPHPLGCYLHLHHSRWYCDVPGKRMEEGRKKKQRTYLSCLRNNNKGLWKHRTWSLKEPGRHLKVSDI